MLVLDAITVFEAVATASRGRHTVGRGPFGALHAPDYDQYVLPKGLAAGKPLSHHASASQAQPELAQGAANRTLS